jgi:hypothetical protein
LRTAAGNLFSSCFQWSCIFWKPHNHSADVKQRSQCGISTVKPSGGGAFYSPDAAAAGMRPIGLNMSPKNALPDWRHSSCHLCRSNWSFCGGDLQASWPKVLPCASH